MISSWTGTRSLKPSCKRYHKSGFVALCVMKAERWYNRISTARRTFTEQFPEVAAAYARRTLRQAKTLGEIAFALGGRPGARLACAPSLAYQLLDPLASPAWHAASPIRHASCAGNRRFWCDTKSRMCSRKNSCLTLQRSSYIMAKSLSEPEYRQLRAVIETALITANPTDRVGIGQRWQELQMYWNDLQF
jgi:hypothetical protein